MEPFVVHAPRPRYETPLVVLSGALVGFGLTQLIGHLLGWPGSWQVSAAALLLGLAGEGWWWFGIASDGACCRRYERARVALILSRREADR